MNQPELSEANRKIVDRYRWRTVAKEVVACIHDRQIERLALRIQSQTRADTVRELSEKLDLYGRHLGRCSKWGIDGDPTNGLRTMVLVDAQCDCGYDELCLKLHRLAALTPSPLHQEPK